MSVPKRLVFRNRDSVRFVRDVRRLKDSGYSVQQIAAETNCCVSYVRSMFRLLKHGDPRLIAELERGDLPHTVAMQIARAKNPGLQKALAGGYKAGTVNLVQLTAILQRIDEHERESTGPRQRGDAVSLDRHFSNETNRQKRLVQKAKLANSRIVFIICAMRRLFLEGEFVALLGAEGFRTIPSWLAERIKDERGDAV
jgi:ParB family chromosome partitioning protein